MRRSFAIIVTLAFVEVLTLGFAQKSFGQDTDKEVIRPLTAKGSEAALFTLGGLGTFQIGAPGMGSVRLEREVLGEGLEPFDTTIRLSGVAFKYFISDDIAVRILLAFNSMSSGADTVANGKLSTMLFGIGAGIEDHLRPLYSISPYFGAQISFISGSSSDTYLVTTDQEYKSSSADFRIMALAGFDWFFTPSMALGAEGMLGFNSQSFSVTPPSPAAEVSYQSATTIALATEANVHFLVYF